MLVVTVLITKYLSKSKLSDLSTSGSMSSAAYMWRILLTSFYTSASHLQPAPGSTPYLALTDTRLSTNNITQHYAFKRRFLIEAHVY